MSIAHRCFFFFLLNISSGSNNASRPTVFGIIQQYSIMIYVVNRAISHQDLKTLKVSICTFVLKTNAYALLS